MAPDRTTQAKTVALAARKSTPRVVRAQAPGNVTVNSPVTNRKLNLTNEKANSSNNHKVNEEPKTKASESEGKVNSNMADIFTRQRSKTRTLDESEAKVFRPDVVNNNAEMKNLSRKLSAKPKSFFVDLNGGQPKTEKERSSEEEVSYEDDFESYESDFDSYHSDAQSGEDSSTSDERRSPEDNENEIKTDDESGTARETNLKDVKDEERMLDSGSYDLRETQRSAQKNKPLRLDFILEGTEEAEKRSSLTDEGFQDMSTSSVVSNSKTMHVDVLERPFFVDFKTCKRNRRKRHIFERLRRRAEDILGMVTLHEMRFTLFEMQPVPYDSFMAAFGRSDCAQVSVQTLEDAISSEVQTEGAICETKWTQHPVKFSKHDICLCAEKTKSGTGDELEDRFAVLLNPAKDSIVSVSERHGDPLSILLEQRNGVGSDTIQSRNVYPANLKSIDFNVDRLRKFLNRTESRISRILNSNAGNSDVSGLVRTTKLPFSGGYVTVPLEKSKLPSIKDTKVTNVILSETRSHFVVTVHEKCSNDSSIPRSLLCVWDLSLAMHEPLKVLVAMDNVAIGKFRGVSDGIVVAALIDGTIHLWDLSEQAAWMRGDDCVERTTNSVEIKSEELTQTELDREWNRAHGHNELRKEYTCLMQSSAYTSSGANVVKGDASDRIAGLEFMGDAQICTIQDGRRKIVAQICSLQRAGILALWSVVRDRLRGSHDIGRAFWSKIALEPLQTLDLSERIHSSRYCNGTFADASHSFDLSAAKGRLALKWREQGPPFSNEARCGVATPRSAARKRVLPTANGKRNGWETGTVCHDLKTVRTDGGDWFLVAKNCGEVLACARYAGVFKISRFIVANDTSSITRLQVSQNGLPYFVAATETGTVNLCSIQDLRVLLTLDCRNTPPATAMKYNVDSKGRYAGSSTGDSPSTNLALGEGGKVPISSLLWSQTNPFEVGALLGDGAMVLWRLTTSDIVGRRFGGAATACTTSADTVALITPQSEVQVHRLNSGPKDNIELFKKYTSLL
ncbi:unnamed protein product, partial [Iphiclides podalirius]